MTVSCFRCVQYFTALMLVCGLGLIITAGVVKFWYVSKSPTTEVQEGLWRKCEIHGNFLSCVNKDLLKFKENLDFDIVLVGLITGSLSCLLGFVFGIVTLCQRYPHKCLIFMEIIFCFLAEAATVFAIVWALVKIGKENTGWAFYLLYSGGGLLLFSFIFAVLLITMKAPGSYRHRHEEEMQMLRT